MISLISSEGNFLSCRQKPNTFFVSLQPESLQREHCLHNATDCASAESAELISKIIQINNKYWKLKRKHPRSVLLLLQAVL